MSDTNMGISQYYESPEEREIDRLSDKITVLERENNTLRAAQKSCEDCDAPTMEQIRQLERELNEAKIENGRLRDLIHAQRILSSGSYRTAGMWRGYWKQQVETLEAQIGVSALLT